MVATRLSDAEAMIAVLSGQLHNFDRSPADVAEEWRAKLPDDEIAAVEQGSARTFAKVEAARLLLL